MGYETKFYLTWVIQERNTVSGESIFSYGKTLAMVDCGKMGWEDDKEVSPLFPYMIDFNIYIQDSNASQEKDLYGDVLYYATDIKKVEKCLKRLYEDNTYHYPPYLFLSQLLKKARKEQKKGGRYETYIDVDTMRNIERKEFLALVKFHY